MSIGRLTLIIKNTYKILEKGRIFRLVFPDLNYSTQKYINNKSPTASISFLKKLSIGKEKRLKGIIGFLGDWIGNSKYLWMSDFESLELENQGFIDIKGA